MSIPNFQTLMLPLLKLAEDRIEHSFKEAIPFLAQEFALTEAEKKELLPSGKQSKFNNRIYWTKTHLFKAGLLTSERRGAFKITEEGMSVLASNPTSIDTKFLERYEKYREFRIPRKKKEQVFSTPNDKDNLEKALENAYRKLQATLSLEILLAMKQCSDSLFESLVVNLLVSLGYGSSRAEAERELTQLPDKSINGIIKKDKLGFDTIYIQAKRSTDKIHRPEIQKFAGTLRQNARKGMFITTSDFSSGAIDYAEGTDSQIVLVNGDRLAELAIEHNIGVTPVLEYEIKKVDLNYFIEN